MWSKFLYSESSTTWESYYIRYEAVIISPQNYTGKIYLHELRFLEARHLCHSLCHSFTPFTTYLYNLCLLFIFKSSVCNFQCLQCPVIAMSSICNVLCLSVQGLLCLVFAFSKLFVIHFKLGTLDLHIVTIILTM